MKRCRMQKKKAFKIACPECKRVAYTIKSETDIPCPYCGFDFKWKSQGRKVIKEVCIDNGKDSSTTLYNSNGNNKIA